MLQLSLTGGLSDIGQLTKLVQSRSGITVSLGPQPAAQGDPQFLPGTCSADERYIFKIHPETGHGYWSRRAPGEACTGIGAINPDVRVHESGEALDVPPDVNLQSGSTKMIEVGPFRFSADAAWSRFSWWGKKLTPEWQAHILKAFKDSEGGTQVAMPPSFAAYFDAPPKTYHVKYVGLGVSTQPKWNPVARSTHPITGKDYGVFLAITYRYPDKPINDPTNSAKLDFIWAPIFREWYERIWDWIANVASRIAAFVCDKITDPSMAATTGVAAQAGGPVAVAGYGAASLLCSPKTPDTPSAPTDDKPAIAPKLKWPYFVAGGIALLGLLAFFLAPPRRRAA